MKNDYPDEPGSTDDNTSRRAAEDIRPKAATIRDRVYDELKRIYPEGLTPDEGAKVLRLDFMSVRPRFTELFKQGKIDKTTETRPTSRSGKQAAVYKWRPPHQTPEQQGLF